LSSSSEVSSSSEESSSEESSSSEQSSSSSEAALEVSWNIFDGNDSPYATGVVQLGDGSNTEFTIGGNEEGIAESYFTVVGDGTLDLDTSAEAAHQHFAQLDGVVASDGEYPKYFTLIAGVTGPSESSRVLDIEIAMADVDAAGSRLKAIIRADGSNTGVQLERATEGGTTSETSVNSYGLDMLDVFRVYHFAIELTSATHGNVRVYADGSDEPLPNLDLVDVEMRPTSGNGNNFLRFGDGGGSAYQANIDWVIWTDEAAYNPSELTGSLPADIGCINGYGAVSCGDESSSSSSSSSLPDIEDTPSFDFEDDTLGEYPAGFNSSITAYIVVSDERARTGTQSAKMTRFFEGDNVNLRRVMYSAPSGTFKVSVYIPSDLVENVNTYVTLWQDSYTAANDRIADLVLTYNGTLQNRIPGGSLETIEGASFNVGGWNDIEMTWTDIATTGEYTLTVNGTLIGTLLSEHTGRTPGRFEVKYGASSSPVNADVSIFVDSIFAF
jgi:hypothetical protein